MKFDNQPPILWPDPLKVAQANEVRRKQAQEMEERNKQIAPVDFNGFIFRMQYTSRGTERFRGPFCPKKIKVGGQKRPCFGELEIGDDKVSAKCLRCGLKYPLPYHIDELRDKAYKAYKAEQIFFETRGEVGQLGARVGVVGGESEKASRKVTVNWFRSKDQDYAVVYFIDKTEKDGKKTQLFLDFVRNEVRHDPEDKIPGKAIAKLTAIFPGAKAEYIYTSDVEKT